jgi:hypothetical protein
MSRRLASLLLAALSPALALAGDAPVDVGKIEGVYRRAFRNGDSAGAKYTTTDVLKLVRLDKGAAYFDIALYFFNGHMCELSGIAKGRGRRAGVSRRNRRRRRDLRACDQAGSRAHRLCRRRRALPLDLRRARRL